LANGERHCHRRLAHALRKDGKLIRWHIFVFVHTGFQMPALEFAPVAARKRPRAKSTYRCALPEAVINVRRQLRLTPSGIGWRHSDWNAPRRRGNRIL